MTGTATYVGNGVSILTAAPSDGKAAYIDSSSNVATAFVDPSGSVFSVGDQVAWSIGGAFASEMVFSGTLLIAGTEYPVLSNGGNYYAVGLSQNAAGTFAQQSLACFRYGTLILTPSGPVGVEKLRVGDLVMTQAGLALPLRWIGQRHITEPGALQCPIRLRADCLGPGLPRRDLFLSPEHAIFIHGVLIPAQCLLNGDAVTRAEVAEVTYFHLELDRHEVIFAENLPCESFRDEAELAIFDTQHGQRAAIAHEPCAPIRTQGPIIEAVRSRLHGWHLAA
jgi:hypothetical protein